MKICDFGFRSCVMFQVCVHHYDMYTNMAERGEGGEEREKEREKEEGERRESTH